MPDAPRPSRPPALGTRRRIALSIPSLSGGGAEIVTVRLANELALLGHDVDIVVNQGGGVFESQVSAGVRMIDLGATRTTTALPRLIRYLRTEDPGALIAGLLFNNLNALIARAAGRWRGRLILCQHNTFSVEAKGSPKDRLCSAILARTMHRADRIVAVSQGVADDLVRHVAVPRDKVSVIYNPIITRDFAAQAAPDPGHPWLSERRGPVFVAVGRLARQKDYPTLLAALALLRQRVPAKLVVLGEGDLLAELTAKAAGLGLGDAVDFVGFRPSPLPYIARSSALVLTSSFEGFGNVLAEALACGTPVISTACNGPVEILDHGRHGTLVPIGDVAAVAEAMAQVLAQPPDPALLRDAAARFDGTAIARRYMALALG